MNKNLLFLSATNAANTKRFLRQMAHTFLHRVVYDMSNVILRNNTAILM